ncbi:DUF4179 domain-containing protein [Ruminococcus albus]|uniref:DUF4179 domain-containing protein n=1 Tax=Ruminococcus albus TaxID=1264 RepID=A0A1I1JM51_RUMAL|nr:DUF4179 domain-containing protein [Ruminococcus albus]SFC49624.1 hypothetical protein SAMN02910406_01807 [Ruminococcus albus]
MNEMKLLRAFGGISDKHILEASETQRKKINKRIVLLLIAAAVVLCLVSAGRFGLIDVLQRHFMGDLSPYSEQISQTIKQVKNDDITLTVHGFVFDADDCEVVLSVESHSKKGRKIVGDLDYLTFRYDLDHAKCVEKYDYTQEKEMEEATRKLWKKHGLETAEPSLVFSNGDRDSDRSTKGDELNCETNYLAASMCGSTKNSNKYRFETLVYIPTMDYDWDQPLVITEKVSGLSIELYLSDYIEKRELKAVNGDGFENVTISPYSLYVRGTEHDIECGRYLKDGGYNGDGAYSEVTINFKDGSTAKPFAEVGFTMEFDDFNGDPEDVEKFREEQYNDNSNIVDQSLVARVEEDGFFELDNIESVIIDGVEYRYAE